MGKTALVLEGGALRTFYTMGVLDALLDENIEFDYICAVSGGALCAVNYLAKQKERTVNINLTYLHDKRYKSFQSLLKNKSYFNLNFLFSETVESFSALDYKKYIEGRQQFELAVTNTRSGQAEYFTKPKKEEFNRIVASASVPFLSKMVLVDDEKYLDGGISDPIPYRRAKGLGYEKIVVVLTQDRSYRKSAVNKHTQRITRLFYRSYPELADQILNRHEPYNEIKTEIEKEAEKQSIVVIQPEHPVQVSRMESDKEKLYLLYKQGLAETTARMSEIKGYLNQ